MCSMILNFVQEMGVGTDLKGVGSTQQILLLSFLICEAKTGPTSTLFFILLQEEFYDWLCDWLSFNYLKLFHYE